MLIKWFHYPRHWCPLGGGALGGVDNVNRIQELCSNNDAWLHVEGHALAAVTLPNATTLVGIIRNTAPISLVCL